MATFWDVGLLQYITPVLVFILVFALLYAILQKSKFLGGSQRLDFMIAMVVALLALISESSIKLIAVLTTWYVLLIVAVILITLSISSGNAEGISQLPGKHMTIFYLAVIILLVSISNVFGPVFTPYSEGADPGWWALRTIFHPKVFGTLIIMLIALLLIGRVTKDAK